MHDTHSYVGMFLYQSRDIDALSKDGDTEAERAGMCSKSHNC